SHLIVLLIFVYQFLSVALAFVKESARMNTGPLAEIIFSPSHHISCGFIYSQERTNDEVFARPLGRDPGPCLDKRSTRVVALPLEPSWRRLAHHQLWRWKHQREV